MNIYRVGQIVFVNTMDCNVGTIFGEIIGRCDDLSGNTMYWIRNVNAGSNHEYYTLPESCIVNIQDGVKLDLDDWCKNHITEINKAFGSDVSNSLLIVYNTKQELVDDGFGSCYKIWTREVCGKIVLRLT